MNCYKRVPLPAWDFSYARVAPRSAVVGSMGEDAAGNVEPAIRSCRATAFGKFRVRVRDHFPTGERPTSAEACRRSTTAFLLVGETAPTRLALRPDCVGHHRAALA